MGSKGETTYLSVLEAARELRVGRTTLYRRIEDGTIKAVKLGKRTLIPRTEILDLERFK